MKSKFVKVFIVNVLITIFFLAHYSFAIQIEDLVIVAANESAADVAEAPMGQTEGEISLLPEDTEMASSEVFGIEGGYFHPYLNISGEWTDNLYNVNQDEKENYLTVISPGIWLSLPRKKVIPISLAPHNTSPGGLQAQLEDQDSTDRYILYALGGLDVKNYSEDSDLDEVDGVAEALFRYNFSSGLSLQVVDRYSKTGDKFGIETVNRGTQGRFNTNFVMATADWLLTEKLRFKFDYSNFYVDYDEDADTFLNRTDNVYDIYGYYNFSVKTSLFLQYRYIAVEYDLSPVNDSTQDFYYGGIQWNTTDKLSMMFKAGMQERDFDSATLEDNDEVAVDFQVRYMYSEKTNFSLGVYRSNEETDSTVASDQTVFGGKLMYNQEFSEKFSGSLGLVYDRADYTQIVTQDRVDDRFSVRPALSYLFREWMKLELYYMYEEVDSTDDIFDYSTNTVGLGLNLAI